MIDLDILFGFCDCCGKETDLKPFDFAGKDEAWCVWCASDFVWYYYNAM